MFEGSHCERGARSRKLVTATASRAKQEAGLVQFLF